jgi:hypothetical protein
MAVDKTDDSIYLAGSYTGMLDFGCATNLLKPATQETVYLAKLDKDGMCQWTIPFASVGGPSRATAVAVGSGGSNVAVACQFGGIVTVPGAPTTKTTLTAVGANDAFIALYKPDSSSAVWVRQISGDGEEIVNSLDKGSGGQVFAAGTYSGVGVTIDTGPPGTGAGVKSSFVYSIPLDSTKMATSRYIKDSASLEEAFGVALYDHSSTSEIAVAGQGGGTKIDFGGGINGMPAGGRDAFLARYPLDLSKPSNTPIFYGDSANAQEGHAVVYAPTGDLYFAGVFSGGITFGASTLSSTKGKGVFVTLFKGAMATPTPVSLVAPADAVDQMVTSIAVSSTTGDVAFVGAAQGAVELHDAKDMLLQKMPSGGGMNDVFIAVMDKALGTVKLLKRWGDGQDQIAQAVAFNSHGELIVAGNFQGTLDFHGGQSLTSMGMNDIFVAKLPPP